MVRKITCVLFKTAWFFSSGAQQPQASAHESCCTSSKTSLLLAAVLYLHEEGRENPFSCCNLCFWAFAGLLRPAQHTLSHPGGRRPFVISRRLPCRAAVSCDERKLTRRSKLTSVATEQGTRGRDTASVALIVLAFQERRDSSESPWLRWQLGALLLRLGAEKQGIDQGWDTNCVPQRRSTDGRGLGHLIRMASLGRVVFHTCSGQASMTSVPRPDIP